MRHEKSCGVITYNRELDKYLIIRHRGGQHWDFPKGHVEIGETEVETALREVKEETSVEPKLVKGFKRQIQYTAGKYIEKEVIFFLGISNTNEVTIQQKEIEEFKWATFEEALNTLTYDKAKSLLKDAEEYLKLSNNKK